MAGEKKKGGQVMMRIAMVVAAVLPLVATADAVTNATKRVRSKFSPEERAQMELKHQGGWLIRPNSGKGYVLAVNRVGSESLAAISNGLSLVEQQFRVFTRIAEAPLFDATVTIEVLSGDGRSSVVWYPDEIRAVIDIAALKKDGPDAAKLNDRVAKEIVRAFGFLVGGGYRCYGNSPLAPIQTAGALDRCETYLPIEMEFQQNGQALGLRPYERVSYRQAAQEGWAPAPKDKYQERIMRRVHTPPEKPLKITYDKAAQKPVVK